jgi:hypothetical protein
MRLSIRLPEQTMRATESLPGGNGGYQAEEE